MTDPPTDCFCGCGRSAAFGQARALSVAARRVAAALDVLPPGDPARTDGERLLALARAVLHDDAPRGAHIAAALDDWP